MDVDLSACVAKLFAELDIAGLIADINAPAEAEVELTGRTQRPVPEPRPAR